MGFLVGSTSLRGRRAVVFGASSGIGFAAAERFAAEGATVCLVARDLANLNAAAARVTSRDVDVAAVDGCDPVAVREFFDGELRVDHVVIAFGSSVMSRPFRERGVVAIRQHFEEKFFPHMTVAHESLAKLSPNGSITFVSGGAARAAFVGSSAWASVDGAIDAIVPTLAIELAPIRVNAVSPGTIATEWWSRLPLEKREELFDSISHRTPVGRVGNPSDVADAIAFLAGNEFITGTTLAVDGGAVLKMNPTSDKSVDLRESTTETG